MTIYEKGCKISSTRLEDDSITKIESGDEQPCENDSG